MNRTHLITVIFISTLFLSTPRVALSQQEERLAVIFEYKGDVKVEHESIKKTVKKIGNRIRNSAVYEDDSVMTMHNSTADLIFNDNTDLEIAEDTSLTINTREMSGDEITRNGFIRHVSGTHQGLCCRKVQVKFGKILANITPSKSVLTEFETPTGTASVRGTAFTLAYIGGVTSIDLTQGLIGFADAGNDVSFSIEPGDNIDISMPEVGHTSIGVRTGQLDVTTDTGTLIVESGESTHVDIDADTGEVHVTADEGTVDFETSAGMAVIEEGEVAGTSVDSDTGEVTISSEEGSVVFETETGAATIEEGASATTIKDCADTCSISMGAEDGTVEFETASGKVVIEDGEAAGTVVDEETGLVTVSAEEGVIVYETNMGTAVMEEGVVVDSLVDMETGEVSVSAVSGTALLETGIGTISMEEGCHLDVTVNEETGEVTVKGVEGDVTITTDDGTTTGVGAGASLGISPVEPQTAETEYSADIMNESRSEQNPDGEGAGDEAVDGDDALPGDPDEQTDTGGDSVYDGTDTDASGDPTNPTDFQQSSFDADADSSESDEEIDNDGDGVYADTDPDDWNADITGVDIDGDGIDAAVDPDDGDSNVTGVDIDGDGIDAAVDSDDWDANVSGVDIDEDGIDAAIDPDDEDSNVTGVDIDGDGIDAAVDSDDWNANVSGVDNDGDGVDAAIDPDDTNANVTGVDNDGDGVDAAVDPDDWNVNVTGVDVDGDGVDAAIDPDDNNANVTGVDNDGDGVDAAVDPDDWNVNVTGVDVDEDGVDAAIDPDDGDSNITGVDNDGDGIDAAVDPDDWNSNVTGVDVDEDGVDAAIDPDDNNPNITPDDVDGDGIDNNTDTDDDGDGVPDAYDTSPLDSSLPDFYEDFSSGGFSNPPKGTAWDVDDNVVVRTAFGKNFSGNDIIAIDGDSNNKFAVIHTGGDGADVGELKKQFDFTYSGNRNVTFDYNFITTEPAWDPDPNRNDEFTAELHLSDGSTVQLAYVSLLTWPGIHFSQTVSDLPTDILDSSSGYQTGWLSVDWTGYVPSGITELHFHVIDDGNSTFDSAVLLDNVVDPPVADSSTDYMLTFARMLRGDVNPYDADLEVKAVVSAEHQAFIDKVNEVINDLENSSDSEFMAGKDEFFDKLQVARDSLANHEEANGFVQKAGVAHHLLEASIMTNEGIGTNIGAIQDSINQANTFLVAHINDFGETDALLNIKTNIDSVLANIENVNNNEFTTATLTAIRDGIKKSFSDTIDHMSGHNHLVCDNPDLPCYGDML